MKIAILHYHLRRGGVTSVIKSVARALMDDEHEIVVLSGEASPEGMEFPLPVEVVPRLNYLNQGTFADSEELVIELVDAAKRSFGGGLPDVWHVHNHSLAKNVLLPAALVQLSQKFDARLLLQFHDFSEDSRPENYARQLAFEQNCQLSKGGHPVALPNIHFAALNHRDLGFLRASGVPDSRVSILPNPVAFPDVDLPSPKDRPFSKDRLLALYPTRAIRRKNLGEIVLLAAMHRETHHFATTLIPENEQWLKYHDHWADVIDRLNFPVSLGIGNQHDFFDLLGWSDMLVTTAVAEGFGLAFLEPWLIDKPLVGRDLPEITSDFGLDLSALYPSLPVPASWVDQRLLIDKIEEALQKAYSSYHREMPGDAVKRALSSFYLDEDTIEFGRLDEELQTSIIEKAVCQPFLIPPDTSVISENGGIARERFDLETYRERLNALYEIVTMGDSTPIEVDADVFLDQFLDPERLNLLRTD